MRSRNFSSFRTIMVPVVYGTRGQAAFETAKALKGQILLVGLVGIPDGESLSHGAPLARKVRARIRSLADGKRIRSKAQVPVSHDPWQELVRMIGESEPDMLLLEWDEQFKAMGITPADVLTRPPCNVGLVRGPFPAGPLRILVPIRGGPHAELALRTGLSLEEHQVTTLHLQEEKSQPDSEASFRPIQRVLAQMPEVNEKTEITADPAGAVLHEAADYNLIILGATAQPLVSSVSLGPVADRVLQDSPVAVLAVKSRRPMPHSFSEEAVGAQAISILVDKWFAENTFHADEFSDLRRLADLKRQRGCRVSLALPALNEEETVGRVIRSVKTALMDDVPLLDEIVLIDSNSTDRTREIARRLHIPVYIHQNLLPEMGARAGKGEALWKSLLVTRGDILLWIDTDIVNIHPRFVYGILGPLLQNPAVQFVKGFYRRPLRVGDKTQAGGGGRVTELTARPLLNLFYPELSGIIQPLSGEYGARRGFLEQTPFFSSYGVETGLLIDAYDKYGLGAIAQVDLLERIHHNQPLEALSKMSFMILQAFLRKLEKRYGQPLVEDVNKSMKLIRQTTGVYFLDVEEIPEQERPPMNQIEEYRKSHPPEPSAESASSGASGAGANRKGAER